MFQFTTTNVINSDKDLSTGKALWSLSKDQKSFFVKRVNNFLADNVVAIYKAEACDPVNAKVVMEFTGLGSPKNGDAFRLCIYLGLTQASQDSRYSNDLILKGKPFTVDFVWDTDAETTLKKLIKTINKYELLVYGDKLLKASSEGNFLVLEAVNEYQRFKVVNIESFDKEAYNGVGEYTPVKTLASLTPTDDVDTLKNNNTEGFYVGKEGFGTYSFLLHNLRLPTSARTRAFAINQEETPILGAKYNQYTIHYCAKRGILGLNAVGDVTKSLTTHVFYVREDLAADFEDALTDFAANTPAGDIEEVPA